MATVVVDASAMVELLLRTERGRRVQQRLLGHQLAAPAHLDAEVLSALARLARADAEEGLSVRERVRRLAAAPIRRYPCAPLLEEAWSLHHNVAVRDALYVALARGLAAALVTADVRLSRSPGSVLGVEVWVG